MYEDFFGMSHRPFPSVPSLVGYLESGSHAEAMETILRCVRRDEGVATLIAPAGLGKSTLAMRLQNELENEFDVVRLGGGHCGSRRALLQAISYELGLPHRGLEEGELRIQLAEYVERLDGRRVLGVVILADEADLMPIRLLEELRLLTNFTHKERSRVSVVLMGNLALEERLSSPYLSSFNQRIGARAYLQPLTAAESAKYIRQQIRQTGIKRPVFDDSALEAIYARTHGIPRLTNQLCDHTLLLASLGGLRVLDGSNIEESWADFQRLPAPKRQIRTDAPHATDSVIEFGSLDDASHESHDYPSVVRFEDRPAAQHHDEYQPQASQQQHPEIELVFQNATNPFAEPFDKEEVIIDRYVSLGDHDMAGIRRVISPRNSEIAAFLVGSDDHHADVDVVQPEYIHSENMVVSRDFSTASTSFTQSDDRDIIVIDSEEKQPEHPKMPTPRRRTYRQLFSQLRREHA